MHAKVHGLMIGILVMFLLSGLAQSATVECDSCADCNAKVAVAANGDLILMNASFSTTATCIGFPEGANNITIDCQGNTVWGSNDACLVGIGSYQTFYNTIQNCNFYGFDGAGIGLDTCAYWSVINSSFRWGNFTGYCGATGINLLFSQFSNFTNVDLSDNAFGFNENYACDGNIFTNITANRNIYGNGFTLGADTKYNIVDGLVANDNAGMGLVFMWGANYSSVSNVRANRNAVHGFYVLTSNYNNVSNFEVSGSGTDGIYIDDGESNGNIFYNGIFNNTLNYVSVNSSNVNYWNTTLHVADNILGGFKLGGNFWSGYSESCVDATPDGICDVPLVLDASNTDELPLKYYPTFGSPEDYTLSLIYSPYASVGETVPIHAYVTYMGVPYNLSMVDIYLDGMSETMTWDTDTNSFIAYWIPSENGDFTLNVTVFTSPRHLHSVGLIKVRTPFNITVRLWNNINMTAGSEYRNEFSWIYMTKDVDPTLHVIFGRNKFACPPQGNDECYWHAAYRNGTATVTLYEAGNYTMYILGNNIEWTMATPIDTRISCDYCPPVKTQSRFLLNLGSYYFMEPEDLDLFYSNTELYYFGGFFGGFASWANMFIFAIIGFVFFLIVLIATGSLKSALAVLIILPSILWLVTNMVLW